MEGIPQCDERVIVISAPDEGPEVEHNAAQVLLEPAPVVSGPAGPIAGPVTQTENALPTSAVMQHKRKVSENIVRADKPCHDAVLCMR